MKEDILTPDDIRSWQKLEVTKLFFTYLDVHIQDADSQVHLLLEKAEPHQASLTNAGMVQLQEVVDIPDRMGEDLKEEQ